MEGRGGLILQPLELPWVYRVDLSLAMQLREILSQNFKTEHKENLGLEPHTLPSTCKSLALLPSPAQGEGGKSIIPVLFLTTITRVDT